jgi:hypothetical protein
VGSRVASGLIDFEVGKFCQPLICRGHAAPKECTGEIAYRSVNDPRRPDELQVIWV